MLRLTFAWQISKIDLTILEFVQYHLAFSWLETEKLLSEKYTLQIMIRLYGCTP